MTNEPDGSPGGASHGTGGTSAPGAALPRERRLRALAATGLLDSPPDEHFDRLTNLVCRLLDVPIALVTLIDAHRQFFKSEHGLPEPWSSSRETPLTHSFCQYVASSGAPLVVADAREHPLLHDNRAIREMGVIAYLGVPLMTPDGIAIGALAAIDGQARHWTEDDQHTLAELGAFAASEVHLHLLLRSAREQTARIRALAGEVTLAEHRERRRLSQLLHDGPQQMLYGLRLRVQLLHEQADTQTADEVRTELAEIDRYLSEATETLKSLTVDLGPPLPKGDGFAEALQWLVLQLERTFGLDVEIVAAPDVRVTDDRHVLLFQLVRELLINAAKHAGTSRASVEVTVEDGRYRVAVQDRGRGLDVAAWEALSAPERGYGLASVRERAEIVGGHMEITSAPGRGTRVTITLPSS